MLRTIRTFISKVQGWFAEVQGSTTAVQDYVWRKSKIMFGGSPRLCLAEVQGSSTVVQGSNLQSPRLVYGSPSFPYERSPRLQFVESPSEGSLADVQGFNLQLRKSTRLCLAEVLRLSPTFYLVQVERLYTGVQEFNMRKSKRHH